MNLNDILKARKNGILFLDKPSNNRGSVVILKFSARKWFVVTYDLYEIHDVKPFGSFRLARRYHKELTR